MGAHGAKPKRQGFSPVLDLGRLDAELWVLLQDDGHGCCHALLGESEVVLDVPERIQEGCMLLKLLRVHRRPELFGIANEALFCSERVDRCRHLFRTSHIARARAGHFWPKLLWLRKELHEQR
eukprot:7855283-Alexandrium_andersonii.AAC.1